MRLIRNMRAGARLWADSIDSQTTGREEGKKTMGKGCNVTRGGTKQLSVFCHMKPLRNIRDRNCRPRHHGGLFLCLRQVFIPPIWGWCKQEIFLLIMPACWFKKNGTKSVVHEDVQKLQRDSTKMSHISTNDGEFFFVLLCLTLIHFPVHGKYILMD